MSGHTWIISKLKPINHSFESFFQQACATEHTVTAQQLFSLSLHITLCSSLIKLIIDLIDCQCSYHYNLQGCLHFQPHFQSNMAAKWCKQLHRYDLLPDDWFCIWRVVAMEQWSGSCIDHTHNPSEKQYNHPNQNTYYDCCMFTDI